MVSRDRRAFLWALAFRVPAFLNISFAFCPPAFLYKFFCIPPRSFVPVSRSYVPAAAGTMGGGGGLVSSECCHLGVLLWGGGRGMTRLSLTTNGGQTCVTECTSMWVGGNLISCHLFNMVSSHIIFFFIDLNSL